MADTRIPIELRLIAADKEAPGVLTSQGDEPAVTAPLNEESLSGVSGIFLAGSAASGRQALEEAGAGNIIDLTYAAEESAGARVRAPMVEGGESEVEPGGVAVIAHPAAIAVALVLRRLHAHFAILRSVVHVFEPASERGAAGVDELHQQTASLLSFKSMPKKVFGEQLGFNMLAAYGEDSPAPLSSAEARLERHLELLLELPGEGVSGLPVPSLRLIQAPVFHGHSASLWVEFEENPGLDEVEHALAADSIDVRGSDMEPPTPVGMAGQSGIAVGAIAPDRSHAQAYWVWMVADNLRIVVENALAVARELL